VIYSGPQVIPDQWQVQILAKILQWAEVYLYSSLPESDIRLAQLKPVHDIAACVRQLREAHSCTTAPHRIAILPEGPQTVPYLI
jgi:hypothetical protein